MSFRRNNRRGVYLRPDRIERATVGTHVPHGVHPRNHSGAWNTQGSRGHSDFYTSGSKRTYYTRSNSFALNNQHSAHIRTILIAVGIIVAAIVIGVLVGVNVYKGQVNSRMMIDHSQLSALHTQASATDPYNVLVKGELGGTQSYDSSELIMVVHVDPQNHVMTFVSIPSDTQVGAQGKTHDIVQESSDNDLISAVSDLLGCDINHFVSTDAQGFSSLVDSLGGIDATLVAEVDDPNAGSDDISAGEQTLSGAQAIEVCRALNYSKPEETRRLQQQAILKATLEKAFDGKDGWDFLNLIDMLSHDFKTDMSFDDISAASKQFGSLSQATTYTGVIPGVQGKDTTGSYYSVSDDLLSSFMDLVNANQNPQDVHTQGSADPSNITVTVRNGAGTTGGAAKVSEQLTNAGYQVPSQGNTDSYVYDQTLVIYKDDTQKATAESIVELLGCGRTVDASIYYSFDTDIEVIIGKDWAPSL